MSAEHHADHVHCGWTGKKCPKCEGTGEQDGEHSCGTGNEFGEVSAQECLCPEEHAALDAISARMSARMRAATLRHHNLTPETDCANCMHKTQTGEWIDGRECPHARPRVGLDLDDRVVGQLATAAQHGLQTSRWRDTVPPYRHHAAAWGIWSLAMDGFKAELLANGWSVYTPSCLVYGVSRR